MTRPLRGGAAVVSLALATMVVASTQPQALTTPDIDLAALIFPTTATTRARDAVIDFFDFKDLLGDTDVLTVGNGPDDAAALAELLDSTGQPDNAFHINYEFDAGAKVQVLNVFTDENTLTHDSKLSVDRAGGVNCAGAMTCHTDPRTHTTTLTYPDGVIAIIERVDDLAVVTYKTIGEAVFGASRNDVPAPEATPSEPASDPAPPADPAPAPVDPPAAPAAVDAGPRLNVLRPAPNFSPARSGSSITAPGPDPTLSDKTDKFVHDVLTRVTDTVKHLFNPHDGPSGIGKPGSAAPGNDR